MEFDPDLKVFATLVDEGKLSDETRKQLQDTAEKGNSLASYVLGRHALAMGNKPKAGRTAGQGPAGPRRRCEAARLLLTIDRKHRPSAVNSEAKVAAAGARAATAAAATLAKSK